MNNSVVPQRFEVEAVSKLAKHYQWALYRGVVEAAGRRLCYKARPEFGEVEEGVVTFVAPGLTGVADGKSAYDAKIHLVLATGRLYYVVQESWNDEPLIVNTERELIALLEKNARFAGIKGLGL